jgi:hypothetical protein
MTPFFTNIKRKLSRIETVLSESEGGHIPHPEDSIFTGSSEATKALQAMVLSVKDPRSITLKLDGKIALIFGRDATGKFIVVDKHMFAKKDGSGRCIYSPEDFYKYDMERGANRSDLYTELQSLWPNLEKAYGNENGYLYWGDLLFSKPLSESGGFLTFKGNPKGINYQVDIHSKIGKFLSGKESAIAVSKYLPSSATTLTESHSLNGGIGRLQNNSNCAILSSGLPMVPKLSLPNDIVNDISQTIANNKKLCDSILKNRKLSGLFQTFINRKVRSGDLRNLTGDFDSYASSKGIDQNILIDNDAAIKAVFEVWLKLYNCKQRLVQQLASYESNIPIKGYLNDGTPSQEGYVSNGYKFINRLGFSRQNLTA